MGKYNYNKTNWIGGKTVGTADVMNNLEEGVYQAHEQLENVNSQLEHIKNKVKVNINDFMEYVVISDGTEDWWLAIQNAIDFVYNRGGGVVELNAYDYNISKPLLLNSDHDCHVSIIGEDRNATKITKHNNNCLGSGEYSNVDAMIILSNLTDYSGYHKIKNLTLNGRWNWSEDGNHSQTEYGIYANKNISFVEVRNIHIDSDKGMVFTGPLWQSIISDFRLHTWTRGIYIAHQSSTSNLIEKGYVMNCRGESAIAYRFSGTYSSANSLACDSGGGILYQFAKADWCVNGIGCEGMSYCDVVINVENKSNVVINSPTLFVPKKENSKVFHCYSDSNIIVNGGSIGEKLNPHTNDTARLISLGWKNTTLRLNGVAIYDTFNMRNEKLDDNSVNAFIDGENVFSIIKNIDGNFTWAESSRGSNFTTYYTTIELPSYVKWGKLSDVPTFKVIESVIPISVVKNKPIYFSNISSHKSGTVNELFLTVPNDIIPNNENLKTFLTNYPIKIKIDSLEA